MNGAAAWIMAKKYADDHGGSGTSNYNNLTNKPTINGQTLTGAVTLTQIGAASNTNLKKICVTVGTASDCDYICDGVADDVQIQQAVDYVNGLGGGDIIIRPGTYNITTCVYLKSHVHISAYGATFEVEDQWSFELPTPTPNSYTITLPAEVLAKVKFGQEIAFTDGSTGYVTDETKAQGNFITDISNGVATFENKVSAGFTHIVSQTSIFRSDVLLSIWQGDNDEDIIIEGGVYNCKYNSSTGLRCNDMYCNGLIFGGIRDLIIKNLEVKNVGHQGIHYTGDPDVVSNGYIENVVVHDCGSAGICLDSIKYISVKDCTAYNCLIGVQLVMADESVVEGGKYYNNSFNNVRIVGSIEPIYRNTVKNVIMNNSTAVNTCLGISNALYTTISGCQIYNANKGIYLESNTKHSAISGNTINGCVTAIYEDNTCDNNKIGCVTYNSNTTDLNVYNARNLDNTDTTVLDNAVLNEGSVTTADSTTPGITSVSGLIYVLDKTGTPYFNTKNLFDYSTYVDNTEAYMGYRGVRLTLEPNTAYTCTTELKTGNTVYFGQGLTSGVEESGGSLTANSDANGYIYIWILSDRANYNDYINGVLHIQIEKGSNSTVFVPYSKRVSLKVGINLVSDGGYITGGSIRYRSIPLSDSRVFYNTPDEYYDSTSKLRMYKDKNFVYINCAELNTASLSIPSGWRPAVAATIPCLNHSDFTNRTLKVSKTGVVTVGNGTTGDILDVNGYWRLA